MVAACQRVRGVSGAALALSVAVAAAAVWPTSSRDMRDRPQVDRPHVEVRAASPEFAPELRELIPALLRDDAALGEMANRPFFEWTVDESTIRGDVTGSRVLRHQPVFEPDSQGCVVTSAPFGVTSANASTSPPPASVPPPMEKPFRTVERGSDCGPGTLRWRFRTGDIVSSSAAFYRGSAIIGSRDGSLYSLDVDTGELLWQIHPLGDSVDVIPHVDGDEVVFASGRTIALANAATGELKWERTFTSGRFQSSPLIVGDRVYAGGSGRFLRALDRRTGESVWEYEAEMWIQSSVAYNDGRLYIGSDDGFLHCVDAEDGTLLWRFPAHLPGPIPDVIPEPELPEIDPGNHRSNVLSTPRFHGRLAFITSVGGMVYAVDRITGEAVWSFYVERLVTDTSVDDGVVYVHSDESVLRALDAETGELRWAAFTASIPNLFPGPYHTGSAPAFTETDAVIGGADGDVIAFDKRTGMRRWSFRTGGWVMSSPRIVDDVIVVGSNDGWVYALNL